MQEIQQKTFRDVQFEEQLSSNYFIINHQNLTLMKNKKGLLLGFLLVACISVEATMLGWSTNWKFLQPSEDGNCIIEYAYQTEYIFWIAVDTRIIEVGRNCLN